MIQNFEILKKQFETNITLFQQQQRLEACAFLHWNSGLDSIEGQPYSAAIYGRGATEEKLEQILRQLLLDAKDRLDGFDRQTIDLEMLTHPIVGDKMTQSMIAKYTNLLLELVKPLNLDKTTLVQLQEFLRVNEARN